MSTPQWGTCFNPVVSLWSCLHRYCFPVTFLTAKRDTSIGRITANIPRGSEQATSVLCINKPHVQEQPLELNIHCQCCSLGFTPLSELLERGRNISDWACLELALSPSFLMWPLKKAFHIDEHFVLTCAYEHSHCLIRDELTLYLFPSS